MSTSTPQTQRTRTTRPKMIGAHSAPRKIPHDHYGAQKRTDREAVAHFWRKRGGPPQVWHGGFSR